MGTAPFAVLCVERSRPEILQPAGFPQKSGGRDHVRPPSVVAKARPSAVVTAAVSASPAVIAWRSTASGNGTRTHERPSVDRNTVPACPISQQTDGDGEDPAISGSGAPVTSFRHVGPPSADR